jgi:hypothetical protein
VAGSETVIVAVLGDGAAVDRPVWALRYLGEVPACVVCAGVGTEVGMNPFT